MARVSDTIIAFMRRMQGIPEYRATWSHSGYDRATPGTTERFRARPSDSGHDRAGGAHTHTAGRKQATSTPSGDSSATPPHGRRKLRQWRHLSASFIVFQGRCRQRGTVLKETRHSKHHNKGNMPLKYKHIPFNNINIDCLAATTYVRPLYDYPACTGVR